MACILNAATILEPRQLYSDARISPFLHRCGGKGLLSLGPDVAVMEPTGVNYMKLWAALLQENGVRVVLVGHKQLLTYRENQGLPDKDDPADALALACYYQQHHNAPSRFVRLRDPVVAKIRDIVLRLHYLNSVQSPLVNRTPLIPPTPPNLPTSPNTVRLSPNRDRLGVIAQMS